MKKGDLVRLNKSYYDDPYAYHDDYKEWCVRDGVVWHEINDSRERFRAWCQRTIGTITWVERKNQDPPLVYVAYADGQLLSAAPYFETWLDVVEAVPTRSYKRKSPKYQTRLL